MSDEDVQSSRPRADEIYARVRQDAVDELERTPSALAFSGLLSGFTIGASILAYAAALVYVAGPVGSFVAALVYPIGYIAVILGRSQLFTENTLYPVLLVLDKREHAWMTARLWAIVIVTNIAGAVLFALVVVKSPALSDAVTDRIRDLGGKTVARDFATTFWSAILAGWALAMVAWLVEAVDSALAAGLVIAALTFVVGVLDLDHSIASAVEAWAAVLDGEAGFWPALGWQGTALLGNAVGGVFIVSLLNYAQVEAEE